MEDRLPSPSFGITSSLASERGSLCRFLSRLFQCASNPLWFPLACLCVLPLVALVLFKRELDGASEGTPRAPTLTEAELKRREALMLNVEEAGGDSESDEDAAATPSERQARRVVKVKQWLMLSLFVIYYAIFIYDLLSLRGGELGPEAPLEYTHSSVRADGSLAVVYVFHHWTRPLGALLRNVFLAFIWRMESTVDECAPKV